MKDAELYRKQAVESFHERDEYQQAIRIITPKSWIYLVIFLMLFIGAVLWLIFGKITTQVDGQGIILANNAEIINVMSPISGGYVKQLVVSPGLKIKKGQLIATMINPNMTMEVKELTHVAAQEKNKLNELIITSKQEIATKLTRIEASINNIKTISANLLEKKQHLEALLKIQEVAFKKGILSRLELNDMQVAYYDSNGQIAQNQNTMVELNQTRNDYIESWNIKIRAQQEKVAEAESNLRNKMQNLQLTENIFSPQDGIVASSYVKEGDFLTEKQKIINIITNSKDMEVVAFFNANLGKKIKVGMPAKIFPKHINLLEYGGIVGQITFVSELPINPQSIESSLENTKLVDQFSDNAPVFKVRVKLIRSNKTASGYLWTTSHGPNDPLSIGTVVTVGVIVRKERPISLIIPIIKSTKNWIVDKND